MLYELGVDLVLQGHDHIYARTKPIQNGNAVEADKVTEKFNGIDVEYSVNPDGTIYVIPATAGPKVYYKNKEIDPSYYDLFEVAEEHSAAKYGNDDGNDSRPKRSQVQNFVEFNVDGNKLTGITYEIDQNINNGKPFVVDTFGIIKDEDTSEEPVKPEEPKEPVKPGKPSETPKVYWDGLQLKKGQIGRVTIQKPINLWKKDAKGKLTFVRILKPGEIYRVYRYDSEHFGQYGVGDNHYITNMKGYMKYDTPSKAKLGQLNQK